MVKINMEKNIKVMGQEFEIMDKFLENKELNR